MCYQPTSITSGGNTETYLYGAEGERVRRVYGGVTTYYIGGMYEVDSNSITRTMYTFGGQTVAQRTINSGGKAVTNDVYYLHGDHLGSVSVASSSTGALNSSVEYDPWGKVRSSNGTSQTKLNYTGQKLDGDSGLMYTRLWPGASSPLAVKGAQGLLYHTAGATEPPASQHSPPVRAMFICCPPCAAMFTWTGTTRYSLFIFARVSSALR